jgi:hypothetical protein
MAEVTEQIVREAPEIEAYKLGLLQSAKELADQPINLPGQQIADQSFLQQEAARLAQQGIGGYAPYLREGGYTMGDAYNVLAGPNSYGQQAAEFYRQGAMGPSAEMIQGYMNPYQDAIQDEINRAYDIQQNQAASQAVGSGAFGGSRSAITQSEVDRNRASALAQSQAQNFLQAQQAATNELQRKLATGQGLGSLGVQIGESLGTLGLRQASLGQLGQQMGQDESRFLFDVGQRQQAQQQAEIEARRQSDMAQLYEPYQRFSYLSDIYKGAPSTQQTIASATAPSVSPAQQYLGLGIAGLSAAAGAERAGLFG